VRYVLDHGNAAADAPALDCTPENEFFWPRHALANECISLARNALFPSALTPLKLCKKCSVRVRKCSERFAGCASATRNSSTPGEMCIMQQRDIALLLMHIKTILQFSSYYLSFAQLSSRNELKRCFYISVVISKREPAAQENY
jgi:hypothetical protein